MKKFNLKNRRTKRPRQNVHNGLFNNQGRNQFQDIVHFLHSADLDLAFLHYLAKSDIPDKIELLKFKFKRDKNKYYMKIQKRNI